MPVTVKIDLTDDEYERFASLNQDQQSYPIIRFIQAVNEKWAAVRDGKKLLVEPPYFMRPQDFDA